MSIAAMIAALVPLEILSMWWRRHAVDVRYDEDCPLRRKVQWGRYEDCDGNVTPYLLIWTPVVRWDFDYICRRPRWLRTWLLWHRGRWEVRFMPAGGDGDER